MAKTAPLAERSLKYVELTFIWYDFYQISWIYLNFVALRPHEISEALRSSDFSFSRSCELKTYCFVLYKVVTANSGECV